MDAMLFPSCGGSGSFLSSHYNENYRGAVAKPRAIDTSTWEQSGIVDIDELAARLTSELIISQWQSGVGSVPKLVNFTGDEKNPEKDIMVGAQNEYIIDSGFRMALGPVATGFDLPTDEKKRQRQKPNTMGKADGDREI